MKGWRVARDKAQYKACELRGRLHRGDGRDLWISRRVRLQGDVSLGDGVRLNHDVRLTAVGGRIEVGPGTYLGPRTEVNSESSVRIGRDCQISWDVLIMDCDHHQIDGRPKQAPIGIGSKVWIAARACVLKGVSIGDGAVVAAGAVVIKDVAPGWLVAGVPAQPVRPVVWTV